MNAVDLELPSILRSRAAIAAVAKRVIVILIARLPCSMWPLAAATVRRVWRGFRDA